MEVPVKSYVSTVIKVADEVWIATALLHRELPSREDFTVDEIVDCVVKEGMTQALRPGVRVHALQHCVANRPPNPGRYRMLIATGKQTRRLFRPGDPYHPDRKGAKTMPEPEEIPTEYRPLLQWYETVYAKAKDHKNSILELYGLGRDLWKGIDPDEYVRSLREGWE
jgi:hypothetical protein